jgi:hypothetical protein
LRKEVQATLLYSISISLFSSCSRDCGAPENRGTKTYLMTKSVDNKSIDFTVKAMRSERKFKQCTTPQFSEAESIDQEIDISNEQLPFEYRLCHLNSANFNSSPAAGEILSVTDGETTSGSSLGLSQTDIPNEAVATILIYNNSGYILQEQHRFNDPRFLAYGSSLIESCINK